jgi:toluene monooxygenase system ferredoxin subunit
MAYATLCQLDDVSRGEIAIFNVEGQPILLVWPSKGELKAFQGLCPHQEISLADAVIDGERLLCQAHNWLFDIGTGRGIGPNFLCLEHYALRIEDGAVQVDVAQKANKAKR